MEKLLSLYDYLTKKYVQINKYIKIKKYMKYINKDKYMYEMYTKNF